MVSGKKFPWEIVPEEKTPKISPILKFFCPAFGTLFFDGGGGGRGRVEGSNKFYSNLFTLQVVRINYHSWVLRV